MERQQKNVLILTYYWPPSGGAGVQRWLKFVKYLPQLGINPIIYTHSNGEFPSTDESLAKEIPQSVKVYKTEIWEPYNIYKNLVGKKNEKINTGFLTEKKTKKSTLQSFAVWVRGNFFIPDARKFWIKPSVKFLDAVIKEDKIDVIISTGPPHSMHLIALKLKQKYKLPWIADFRDPWTNIDFYKDLKLSKWADNKHHKLEKQVLQIADACLSVGPTLSEELEKLGAKKCITITNGFDEDDIINDDVTLDSKISIAHIGSFTKTRNPIVLFEALNELKSLYPNLANIVELKLVGKVDYTVTETLQKYGLENLVRKVAYMPHNEVLLEQKKSHILLLIVNDTPNAKGILTGKVFEYLAANRPILALAPRAGDLAKLIVKTNSGIVIEQNEKAKLVDYLQGIIEKKDESHHPNNIEMYSRRNLTQQLVNVINDLS